MFLLQLAGLLVSPGCFRVYYGYMPLSYCLFQHVLGGSKGLDGAATKKRSLFHFSSASLAIRRQIFARMLKICWHLFSFLRRFFPPLISISLKTRSRARLDSCYYQPRVFATLSIGCLPGHLLVMRCIRCRFFVPSTNRWRFLPSCPVISVNAFNYIPSCTNDYF